MAMKFISMACLLVSGVFGLLCLSGCDSRKEIDIAWPDASAVVGPAVSYGEGFSAPEGTGAQQWRWMSGEGRVKLKNRTQEMRLLLEGDLPMVSLPQKPNLKLVLNGETLDQFPGAQHIAKEYAIPAEKQKGKTYSTLEIITDQTFVPKELDKNSGDTRRLGFYLTKLEWLAK